MQLVWQTPKSWVAVVMNDFEHFLVDHALCERKASALAMSLVAHYPDKRTLVNAMLDLAIEELEHYKMVYSIISEKNLTIFPDEKDVYVNELRKQIRGKSDYYLLDRLLIAGIIEARGTERFGLLAKELPTGKLKDFYMEFWRSEARHHAMFVRLAKEYYPADLVIERYHELLNKEAQIIQSIPSTARVH